MTITKSFRRQRKAAHRALLRGSLPDDETLGAGLSAAFRSSGSPCGVTVLHREPNLFASSFPSEIVTCRCTDGRDVRVLVKMQAGQSHASDGHRGDVVYEAEVYRHVLHPLDCGAPRWRGTHLQSSSGDCWLVIDYVDGAEQLAKEPNWRAAMHEAARWCARFHAANATRVASEPLRFLIAYDAEYYRHWAHRTGALGDGVRERLPWLARVCERFLRSVELLLEAPTVIHGEYTAKNTLVSGGRIYPVDWESAAIGAGEIDLASLTDGAWPPELVDACTQEYQRARWPAGAPPAFSTRLELARLYWNLRFLGDRPEWTTDKMLARRIESLRLAAERAGLL